MSDTAWEAAIIRALLASERADAAREAIADLAARIRAEDDRAPLPPQEGAPSPFGPLHDLRLRHARREGER